MMRLIRLFLLFSLITIAFAAPGHVATSAPIKINCADFLTKLHIKPADVQFVQCKLENDRQGKPLRAFYRVAGAHAVAAEAFFVRVVKLSPLKKSCCQWDGPPSQFTGKDGRNYTIYMVSPETGVKYRKQWGDIPSFEIVVETLTEDI